MRHVRGCFMTPKWTDGNISPYKRDILWLLLPWQQPSTTRTVYFASVPSKGKAPSPSCSTAVSPFIWLSSPQVYVWCVFFHTGIISETHHVSLQPSVSWIDLKIELTAQYYTTTSHVKRWYVFNGYQLKQTETQRKNVRCTLAKPPHWYAWVKYEA